MAYTGVGAQVVGVYEIPIDDILTNTTVNNNGANNGFPALLHVFSCGNMRVMFADGTTDMLKNYMNDPKLLVIKVFKTDLSIPETDVRLYK